MVLISSSGKSLNILNAAKYAKKKNIQTITLSGMSKKNNLKKMGLINFWVDSKSYNIIETAHQFYMMAVIDLIIGNSSTITFKIFFNGIISTDLNKPESKIL